MYTFCPGCSTMFSLRAEHLHAASGLVRCGQCRKVFSAVDHLYDGLAEARFAVFKLAEVDQDDETGATADTQGADGYTGPRSTPDATGQPVTQTNFGAGWSRQPVSLKDVASGAGIGLLVLLLAGQWAFFNRADLAMDPTNPRILYAAMWNHWRNPWFIHSGGEDGGIFKSTDGGETWNLLANNHTTTSNPSGPRIAPTPMERNPGSSKMARWEGWAITPSCTDFGEIPSAKTSPIRPRPSISAATAC